MVLPIIASVYLFNDDVKFWVCGITMLFAAIAIMSGSAKLHGGVALFLGAFLIVVLAIHYAI